MVFIIIPGVVDIYREEDPCTHTTDNLSATCSLLTESVLTVVFQICFTYSAKRE